jgi:hypothetical protein
MGSAAPEDYVNWAVERLCEQEDSPGLTVLAGLTRSEHYEVERYFKKACGELGIEILPDTQAPRRNAELVRKAYDAGEISAETAVRMTAELYRRSEFSDELLSIWYFLEEEIDYRRFDRAGLWYPLEAGGSLESVFESEWRLFARALRLDPPKGFTLFLQCDHCGHIGEPQRGPVGVLRKIKASIPWIRRKAAHLSVCKACGSHRFHSMAYPAVRDSYFSRLENEQRDRETPPKL